MNHQRTHDDDVIPTGLDLYEPESPRAEPEHEDDPTVLMIARMAKVSGARDAQQKKKN
jgi:hypothetical protein